MKKTFNPEEWTRFVCSVTKHDSGMRYSEFVQLLAEYNLTYWVPTTVTGSNEDFVIFKLKYGW